MFGWRSQTLGSSAPSDDPQLVPIPLSRPRSSAMTTFMSNSADRRLLAGHQVRVVDFFETVSAVTQRGEVRVGGSMSIFDLEVSLWPPAAQTRGARPPASARAPGRCPSGRPRRASYLCRRRSQGCDARGERYRSGPWRRGRPRKSRPTGSMALYAVREDHPGGRAAFCMGLMRAWASQVP